MLLQSIHPRYLDIKPIQESSPIIMESRWKMAQYLKGVSTMGGRVFDMLNILLSYGFFFQKVEVNLAPSYENDPSSPKMVEVTGG